jgi:TP901 family phage tail tape measure protein
MASQQEELAILLTGKDQSASKAVRGVRREVQQLEGIAGKAGANISRNVQRGIVVGAGAAAGAIGYAITTAQSFETATTGIAKTVDGDISAIVTGLEKISTTAPIAYEELAGIAEQGGAFGIAKDDLLDFTETVALLSVTTDLTSESAATALGHLRTTLNLTGEDFRALGDEIVYLGNNGNSTEAEIVAMAEGIAGAAGIVDASKEQVLAWASALASTGEEAEAGGSSIQRFWLESFKTVNEGGKGLSLMAKISGKTAAQFKKDFGTDATGTLATFITSLGKLGKAEQLATLEDLGFTDIRIQRALLKLLANTGNLTDSLHDAEHASGAMGKEASKRFEDSAMQMKILENNVRLAAATVGTELLPIVNELAKEGVAWIQDHQDEIREFGKDLADNIRDAVAYAKDLDWNAIGAALGTAADAAKLIVSTFMAMPAPLQQLLAGGFVANKLTGGAVFDLLKFAVRQMAIQAGVVYVNGALGGGAGGAAGAAGAAGGLRGGLGNLLKIGAGVGLGIGGNMLIQHGAQEGFTPTGVASGIAGGAATMAGGALIAGPLGLMAGAALAVVETQQAVSAGLTDNAAALRDLQTASATENDLSIGDLTTQLAGIDQGIADIRSNPLNMLVAGDALTQLQGMRADVAKQLETARSNDHSGYVTAEAAKHMERSQYDLKMIQAGQARTALEQKAVADRTRDSVDAGRHSTVTAVDRTGATTAAGLADVVGAIHGLHIPTPHVQVTVGPGTVTRSIARYRRAANNPYVHAE